MRCLEVSEFTLYKHHQASGVDASRTYQAALATEHTLAQSLINTLIFTTAHCGMELTEVEVSDIRCINIGESLKARTDNNIRVKVCGPANIINKLNANDVYVVVDLKDKSAGEHTVETVLKSNVYNNVWQVGTYILTVTIN